MAHLRPTASRTVATPPFRRGACRGSGGHPTARRTGGRGRLTAGPRRCRTGRRGAGPAPAAGARPPQAWGRVPPMYAQQTRFWWWTAHPAAH
uniref:trp operon leader peptide n=1 Tax=Streptomyces sp. HSW2009 TaxID=3142890 RepID=UPI0032EB2F7C